jgi:hypothetical protein
LEKYYFNRHQWDVEFKYFPVQRKFVVAVYVLYSLASGLIKLSVILFYRRLAKGLVSPIYRWILITTFVVTATSTMAFVLISIFTCHPIDAFWKQVDFELLLQPGGYNYTCINEGKTVFAAGIISTLTDAVVVIMPTLLCWNLQIPLRQKIALYSIFAVSFTTIGLGAIRTYSSYQVFFATYDVMWATSHTFFWSLLELHIGAMCANAPALKVFVKHLATTEKISNWISSKTRSNLSTGRHDSVAPGTPSTPRTPTWDRFTSWKRPHSLRTSGCISEPHSSVSTDKHGGIVQMKAHFNPGRQRDSMVKPLAPEYKDTVIQSRDGPSDIEMADFSSSTLKSARSSEERDEPGALPRIAGPKRMSWLPPFRSILPFVGR